MVNPQWLRSFVAVNDAGSFTKAADALSVTQAAVSHHIRNLETQLGPLLIRHPRRVELTPAGHALLEYHKGLTKAEKQLQLRLVEHEITEGVISITSPGSIGLALYPMLLDWQQQYSALSIRYRFAPDNEVLEAVLDNRYELGILTFPPDDPKLVFEALTEEPLELVVPKGYRVTEWHDLEQLGFVDHPDGKDMATRLFARAFPGNPGVRSLPCHGFINQVGLLLEPVSRGIGFTVLPRHARLAFQRQEEVEVVELIQQVVDKLWLVYRSEWPLSTRAQCAIKILRQQLPASFTE